MSKAPAKPSKYAIDRLVRETSQPYEICEAAYVEAQCLYNVALTILRGTQPPLKYIPVPEEPIPVTFDGTLTNGNVIRPGMTLAEIDAAVPARATGNPTIDRMRRVMRKVMTEERTPEQWAAFRRMTGATTFEYEGVEA